MILPTKGIAPRNALLSLGGDVLRLLTEGKTVSRLWDELKAQPICASGVTFDWFVLSLDLLFMLDAVAFDRGRVLRTSPSPDAEVS